MLVTCRHKKKTPLTPPLSKSGGLRYSCKTPGYIHPRATENREYIGKWNQQTGEREALYLEIFGDKGLSRWDARYEIITGNLFDLPVIEDIDALFDIIDTLKSKIHAQAPPKKKKSQHTAQSHSNNKKSRMWNRDHPIGRPYRSEQLQDAVLVSTQKSAIASHPKDFRQ